LSQFAGIIGIDERKSNNKMTMGQLIHQISKYEFPNKAIVTLLNDISELRNNLFHNFVKSNLEELKKVISDDFKTITDKTEELGIQEKNP
jgi:uncharacterized protein with HEPN domain